MRQAPPTAAPAAPPTTPARTGRGGATHTASAEKSRGFDQLVDRLADTREDTASDARGSRASIGARDDVGTEARGPEPRAKDKDDADAAAAPASTPEAPLVAPQTTFPWTLPLNPALWTLEPATDTGGDAEAGPQIDRAATDAAVNAASAITVGVGTGIGATQAAAALSVSSTAGARVTPRTPGVGDANDGDATAFSAAVDQAVDQRLAGEIGASSVPEVADAPADAQAELGATFTTHATDDAASVGTTATGDAAQAVAANTTDALSLTASMDAHAGARATAAAGASPHEATIAATLGGATSYVASDATADANADTTDAPGASALPAAQTDATAGVQTNPTAGADRARQQAMQELWRAMARAQGGSSAAAPDAPGTIATDATAAAATPVTERNTTIDAGAVAHADVVVAAQAPDAGPRAKKESKAEAPFDANAWAAANVAGAASAEQASGQSASENGTNGRGREAHPENFGGLVSSLRHASDGGVQGLSPAFEARSLMASHINAGLDSHDASATAASTTIVTTAPPDEQAAQIIRSMRLQWRGSMGEAQLRLTPEHLGQVLVTVKVDQGSVTATMHAETPAAQQWIQAHQQQLRDALDAQGLRVAELQVTTDPEDRPRRDQSEEEPRGRAKPRPRDTEGHRFEIRV